VAAKNIYTKGGIMNRISRALIAVPFLLAGTAQADIPMPVKEHVQTFVWILEALTVVTIVAVFWFVWRYSQRERQKINSNRKDLSR
jgi:heme/copper-type cytochrome/quinol oxidase subunit 2